jgi:hypothetical protein
MTRLAPSPEISLGLSPESVNNEGLELGHKKRKLSELSADEKKEIATSAKRLKGEARKQYLAEHAPEAFPANFNADQISNKIRKWIESKDRGVTKKTYNSVIEELKGIANKKVPEGEELPLVNLSTIREIYATKCHENGELHKIKNMKLEYAWGNSLVGRANLPRHFTTLVGTEFQKGFCRFE